MIDTNYIVILTIILFLLCIVASTICYNRSVRRRTSIEPFKSSPDNDTDNLIIGGDLLNGLPKNTNQTNIEPFPHKNPSTSTNVIEIKGNTKTNGTFNNYLMIKLPTSSHKTTKYNINMWVGNTEGHLSTTIKNNLKGVVDFASENSTDLKCINFKYNIGAPKKISDIVWFNLDIVLDVPKDVTKDVKMYLGYNKNNTINQYYADFKMIKLFDMATDFKYTTGLACMIIPSMSLTGKSNLLEDITHKHPFKSSENLYVKNKGINLLGKTLTGPLSNSLNDVKNSNIKNLSLVLTIEPLNKKVSALHLNDNILSEEETLTSNDSELIDFPGNQGSSLSISLSYNTDGTHCRFIVRLLDNIVGESEPLPPTKMTYFFIYDYGKQSIECYINDGMRLFMHIPTEARIFFDSNNIQVNKNKDNNVNMYALLIYNSTLTESSRIGIYNYISQSNNKSASHMESYSFQKCLDPILKDTDGKSKDAAHNTSTDGTHYNGTPEFKDDITHNNNGLKVSSNCPNVYRQDGNYMVNISYNSKYGKRYNLDKKNRYLVKNYGSDKKTAKEAYLKNYPDCSLPDELQTNMKVNKDHSSSPFMIDNNPNNSPHCYGVKWDMKNPQNMGNISEKCKREVVTHCENNNKYDNACSDWHPNNYDSSQSQTNRRYFQPADPRCRAGNHEIEDHPDYKKYIRRDKVPCWNCKL